MNKRCSIYILFIIIVLILTAILTIAFSFVTKPIIGESVEKPVENFKISYYGDLNISLPISEEDLNQSAPQNDYSSFISKTSKIEIDLTSSEKAYPNGISCTYEIKYYPITFYFSSAEVIQKGLKVLTMSGSDGNTEFSEISLDNAATAQTLCVSSIATSGDQNYLHQTWNLTMKYYNLDVNKKEAIGQKPEGQISVEVISCVGNSLFEK